MLLVYFPNHQLLYGSDLMLVDAQGGFAFTQYVAELRLGRSAGATRQIGLCPAHRTPAVGKVVQATTLAP